MEAYSSSYSSSNASYLPQNPEEAKGLKHVYPFQSQSIRKSPAKPWKKAPVAPMPPTPVKVYKVDPMNFRDLVQQLTCAPEFKPPQPSHQLHQSIENTATSSLQRNPSPPMQNLSNRDIAAASPSLPACNNFGMDSLETTDWAMSPGFLEMTLASPTSYSNWNSLLI